jgi:molybdopterin biosynthesis enzyme
MERPKRNIYLKMKTLPEAGEIWTERNSMLRTREEEIPSTSSLHRVTSRPITAMRSVPHYHGAAMDGFAVPAASTFGASDSTPVHLIVGTSAFPVDTGDPLPPDTDAVIMIEQVDQVSDSEIEIRTAAFPWQHVRKVGEDIVAV